MVSPSNSSDQASRQEEVSSEIPPWPSQAAIYQRYGYAFGSVRREYLVRRQEVG